MENYSKLPLLLALTFLILAATVISISEPSTTVERPSPSNWVTKEQIMVYNNHVYLNIKNASWATFTNTNSMDPILDENSHAIEVLPQSEKEIQIGDIISYKTPKGTFVHRIIFKGTDSKGTYYLVKGDNNPHQDPFKVRFNDINGVIIAIIY